LSFLPVDSSFSALLEVSLTVLSQECPEAYLRICQRLNSREVHLTVDTETVSVRFQSESAQVLQAAQQPTIYVSSTKQTLLDLIDARITLEYAITRDLIHVRGKMDDLIDFYESFQLYIQGAVRCISFPALLSDYRFKSN
jgi:hypothetical protein